ncbi:MAG: alkaline phosphatase family protein [Candidatus Limnocylindrales bacterium]
MSLLSRVRIHRGWRLLPALAIVGALVAPGALVSAHQSGTADQSGSDDHSDSNGRLGRVFVIMLENHSAANVIDNRDSNGNLTAPKITALAHTYGQASQYYGVTHPSLPNYVSAISGSNWFINNDNPSNRFDHLNLVDQLAANHISWGAYMESMPADNKLIDFSPSSANPLYVSKHNPFVLFNDIRNDPARMANVKPYTDLASDLNSKHAPQFVWISPNQCHDLHGGVYGTVDPTGADGTPCPYGTTTPTQDAKDLSLIKKADDWVGAAVNTIMTSKAWTGNSAIFIVTDENDFVAANTSIDQWATAAGCCDSPVLPNGYAFIGSHGTPDGNVLVCPGTPTPVACTYGGGLVPAVVIARHGVRNYTSSTPYNHFSLLRTIEENWHLGYLGNASDSINVTSMNEFLSH